MDISPPRSAALLSRLRINHDPDNGVLGKRVLIQHGDSSWWAGRITIYERENGRQTEDGAPGETAQEAILTAIQLFGEAC
jgi:hypothetical protein